MRRTLPLLFIVFGAFAGQDAHAAMAPEAFNPCAPHGGTGLLTGLENLTDARAPAPRAEAIEPQEANPFEGVVQIACLAANADGELTLNEAMRIGSLKRSEDVWLQRVVSADPESLDGLVDALALPELETALREAMMVIAVDGQISMPEMAFFDALATTAGLPQHRLRVILGLSD